MDGKGRTGKEPQETPLDGIGLFIGGGSGTGALFYCHLPTDSHPITLADILSLVQFFKGNKH